MLLFPALTPAQPATQDQQGRRALFGSRMLLESPRVPVLLREPWACAAGPNLAKQPPPQSGTRMLRSSSPDQGRNLPGLPRHQGAPGGLGGGPVICGPPIADALPSAELEPPPPSMCRPDPALFGRVGLERTCVNSPHAGVSPTALVRTTKPVASWAALHLCRCSAHITRKCYYLRAYSHHGGGSLY